MLFGQSSIETLPCEVIAMICANLDPNSIGELFAVNHAWRDHLEAILTTHSGLRLPGMETCFRDGRLTRENWQNFVIANAKRARQWQEGSFRNMNMRPEERCMAIMTVEEWGNVLETYCS
eukprot:Clim_evm18s241 gene=Clim_evmTU18s241